GEFDRRVLRRGRIRASARPKAPRPSIKWCRTPTAASAKQKARDRGFCGLAQDRLRQAGIREHFGADSQGFVCSRAFHKKIMHKLLLSHPQIGSYSACLLGGIFGGYLLTRWQASRAAIKGSHIDNLALLICLFSLFGARLFSWLFYFPPNTNLWRALWDPAG